jgi:hypothetical protein
MAEAGDWCLIESDPGNNLMNQIHVSMPTLSYIDRCIYRVNLGNGLPRRPNGGDL